MKIKKSLSILALILTAGSYSSQILSEQNVTINMDLQPVLQLDIEGAEVIDFNFTEISQYTRGITRYGANILKVSASVSFDLWAAGFSQGMNTAAAAADRNNYFDNVSNYGNNANAVAVNTIPVSALELHQFPQNPSTEDQTTQCGTNNSAMTANADYSTAFVDPTSGTNGNNNIYFPVGTNPYLAPDDNAAGGRDKYIAGYSGQGTAQSGCQVAGGTYLGQSISTTNGTEAGAITNDGYYFVMDYRIVPGLPVRFPMSDPTNAANALSTSLAAITADDLTIHGGVSTNPDAYVKPGAYQMQIKYIIVEDQ